MRFDLETEVRYPSGEKAGILRKVVLDEGGEVESVVMSTDDLISRNIIVPASNFSEAPGNVLQLDLNDDELDSLPEYVEELVPLAPEGWELHDDALPGSDVFPATFMDPIVPVFESSNLPEGNIGLSQGTEVRCLDGRWGIVDEVLMEDDGQVSAFVGRPDNTEEHDRMIPIELVSEYSEEYVTLNCTLADLSTYTEELVGEAEEREGD